MCGAEGVEGERGLLRRRVTRLAAQRCRPRLVDVLVVPLGRLGRRGEDRLRKALGPAEPGRKAVAADRSRLPVVLPSGAREIAADDALDREHLEPLAAHPPPLAAGLARA